MEQLKIFYEFTRKQPVKFDRVTFESYTMTLEDVDIEFEIITFDSHDLEELENYAVAKSKKLYYTPEASEEPGAVLIGILHDPDIEEKHLRVGEKVATAYSNFLGYKPFVYDRLSKPIPEGPHIWLPHFAYRLPERFCFSNNHIVIDLSNDVVFLCYEYESEQERMVIQQALLGDLASPAFGYGVGGYDDKGVKVICAPISFSAADADFPNYSMLRRQAKSIATIMASIIEENLV